MEVAENVIEPRHAQPYRGQPHAKAMHGEESSDGQNNPALVRVDPKLCPVEVAARIIGQKWTLQIVRTLLDCRSRRFCELQDALGGVNPSTLSSRLKMLEDEGMIRRVQISAIPPHVEYSLTEMGCQLDCVIREISKWSRAWLCTTERLHHWTVTDDE